MFVRSEGKRRHFIKIFEKPLRRLGRDFGSVRSHSKEWAGVLERTNSFAIREAAPILYLSSLVALVIVKWLH